MDDIATRHSVDSETYRDTSGIDLGSPPPYSQSRSRLPNPATSTKSSTTNTPYQSALASASGSSISLAHSETSTTGPSGPGGGADDSFQSQDRQPGGEDLTPYVVQRPQIPDSTSTVVLRHSDELSSDDEDMRDLSFGLDATSPTRTGTPFGSSPNRRRITSTMSPRPGPASGGTADKAGVILGIFNVFIVMPQFVITALSSIIFHIMEPPSSTLPKHPNAIPIGNTTLTDGLDGLDEEMMRLMSREGAVEAGSPDAVGLIFRYVPSKSPRH